MGVLEIGLGLFLAVPLVLSAPILAQAGQPVAGSMASWL